MVDPKTPDLKPSSENLGNEQGASEQSAAEQSASEQGAAGQGAAVIVEKRESREIVTAVVAPTGRRQAFSNIRRQLSEEDLKSSGVQKMILEELERAESQCEILESYRDRFHAADKESAILCEKAKTTRSLEVFFGLGITIGGVMIGLAPYFWTVGRSYGLIDLAVGIALLIGSTLARVIQK